MYWLRTFDGLAIEHDGAPLDRAGAHRKALALLAVLAAQGPTGRERLTALLWPESDAERAKGSLNQAAHLLRRLLDAPDLLLGTAELRLNPERIGSDVGSFSRAIAEGDAASAVRHYGGPFLEGVHIEGTGEFERWASAHRAELERRYTAALEQLAQAAEAEGQPEAAVGWWRQLQQADPLNSRVAIRLMLALEASGDRASALHHARVHEERLREEWGTVPDPEVMALADHLRSLSIPSPGARGVTTGADREASGGRASQRDRRADPPGESTGTALRGGRTPRRARPAVLALALVIGLGGAMAAVIGTCGGGRPGAFSGWRSSSPAAAATTVPTRPERGSIAVLPFADLSPQGDQEYFSDGMSEELITALSRVEGLRVAARTSSFQFKGRHPDVREVGLALGVAHVLEGSVRRAGDRLRITAQLVSTEDGYHVWSETYERSLSSVFEVQEEIGAAIVEALQARLRARGGPVVPAPTASLAAYEEYLRGLHFFNRLQIPQAVEALEGATRLDPLFARAHAALAEAYALPAAYADRSLVDTRSRGVAAADAALRLEPALADAHAALGWLEMIGLRWGEAERALGRAIELDPDAPRARLYYALFLHRQGQWGLALEQIAQARELDPLSLPINAIYGSFLGDLGRTDEAVAHLQATLELEPSFPVARAVLGHILLGAGRPAEAIRHYERVAEAVPTSFYAGFLGHAYARAGRTEEARRVLADLRERAERGEPVSPGAIGWVLLGLEEREEGFLWMERAARERDVFLTIYGVLTNRPLSEPFRDDPRFQRLRSTVGLAP